MENKNNTPDKVLPTTPNELVSAIFNDLFGANIHILKNTPANGINMQELEELYFFMRFLLHFRQVMPCTRVSKTK